MTVTAISVRGLSKTYRVAHDRAHTLKEALIRRDRSRGVEQFVALDSVSLDVEQGSFFGVVGHNGSGKSTLLKLMAGIHRPSAGTIEANGRLAALLELGSGFHPELSGRDNIYLNAAILGLRRAEIDAVIDDIIDFADIGDFVDAPVKVLSSGMYVRLGFAVSVHVSPDILLIDEVLAVGDEAFQRKCLDRLETMRAAGVTIVLVSHGLDMVRRLCDRAAWLHRGKLAAMGRAEEVCDAYLASVDAAQGDR